MSLPPSFHVLKICRRIVLETVQRLRSIVMPKTRPFWAVRDDLPIDASHLSWPEFNPMSDELAKRMKMAIRATGRIEFLNDGSYSVAGTGFLIAPDIVVTNHHVAIGFADYAGPTETFIRDANAPRINFLREKDNLDPDEGSTHAIIEVLLARPEFDFAVLRIADAPRTRSPLVLCALPPEALPSRRCALVGYPKLNEKEDVTVQKDMIETFDVKHVSPGLLTTIRQHRNDFNKTHRTIGHDLSSLTGNSGSPVVDLETGEVLAVHFNGKIDNNNLAILSVDLLSDRNLRIFLDGPPVS